MSGSIRCTCGNRVKEEDLIEAGLFVADTDSGSVYVKFICSRCEKVAQRTLSLSEWDEGRILFTGLEEDEGSLGAGIRPPLGIITYSEIRTFEQEVDSAEAMAALRSSVSFPKRRSGPGEDNG